MRKNLLWSTGLASMASMVLFAHGALASTPYGALYEAGELVSGEDTSDGTSGNTESSLIRHPNEDTWIAMTTNNNETQWFRSDEYALNWTQIDNPLDFYDCMQPGRHSLHIFQQDVYFAYHCAGTNLIARLEEGDGTGQSAATVVFDSSVAFSTGQTSVMFDSFPTSAVLDGVIYFFSTTGILMSEDGATFTQLTIPGYPHPTSVPLEASAQTEDADGNSVMYLPFVNGEVYEFDGTAMTLLGENYLDEIGATNLPSIGLFQDELYVGNDNTDGAKLKKWDGEGATTWTEVYDFATQDPNNRIINKMLKSQKFEDDKYLVFFTSNNETGVEVGSIDADGNFLQLIDDGLGGTNPENNSEVISAVRSRTAGSGSNPVMLFSTKASDPSVSESKVYILQLSDTFDLFPRLRFFDLGEENLSSPAHTILAAEKKLHQGNTLKVTLPKNKVKAGYEYALYINGEGVDSATGKAKGSLTLEYEGAADLETGTELSVRIGTTPAYGPKGDKLISTKEIKGPVRVIKVVQ